ncbi:unnamed protein product [Owenia fusiformis]|uniref:Major facilitator superfamily (MFS) profile domain-containing protein n=1 Tax=Owenia fusiformis TaxID=6347 RepID=A0A8S4N3W4_OWEFU|nr:unnamed protein product [Owenia fusiformis]
MLFDELLILVGPFGLYQKILILGSHLFGYISAWQNLNPTFIGGEPQHWCSVPEIDSLGLPYAVRMNLTTPTEVKDGETVYSSCRIYDRNYTGITGDNYLDAINWDNTMTRDCDTWVYSKELYVSSIATEWDLVCGRKWMKSTLQSIFFAGRLFGAVFFGFVADRFGRKKIYIATLLGTIVTSISTAFLPEIISYTVFRFLTACFITGSTQTSYVILMELIGPKYRVAAGTISLTGWTLGMVSLAGLAYAVREWRRLQLLISIPSVVFLGYVWLYPESPRWLRQNGKEKDAKGVIKAIAHVNNACDKLPEKFSIDLEKGQEAKGNFIALFKTPNLRKRTLILSYVWFSNSLVYYGLSLNTSNLGGNPYVNFFISGAVEIVAKVVLITSFMYIGRRLPFSMCMLFGGVCLIATIAVPLDKNVIIVVLSMAGKLAIAASFDMAWIYSAEVYPTPLRASGVGFNSMAARIAGIISAYVGLLSDVSRVLPLILLGIVSLVSGLLALFLPETKGKPLPETIEDGEQFGQDHKCFSCGTSEQSGTKYDMGHENNDFQNFEKENAQPVVETFKLNKL